MKEGMNMAKHIYNAVRSATDERDFTTKLSPHQAVNLPRKISLRGKCPIVFDQGDLGSCTANAIVFLYIMFLGLKSVMFSRLFVYFFERQSEGTTKEDAGAQPIDGFKAVNKKGICEERFWPYVLSKFMQSPPAQAIANALKYPKPTYVRLLNLTEIKQHIALTSQPVSFGMDAYDSFEGDFTFRTGIISMPKANEEMLGGHDMAYIGYDDDMVLIDEYGNRTIGALEYRNSYGPEFGEKGYGWMSYTYFSKFTWDYLCFQK